MADGPLAEYRARRRAGRLRPDPAQGLAGEKLQSLANALAHYQPSSGRAGWRDRLGLARRREDPPQGLYIFGGVGCGKSMLMDLFFETAPVKRKRRVHFHAFMQEVHDCLHRLRQQTADADSVPALAAHLAESAWLLCFDEFQVTNIADAMLLGRLFGALFDLGIVVVATSNKSPDELYAGGLQRERFLPFIALLRERLDILELDGEIDYRLARLRGMNVYHCPLGESAAQTMNAAFASLADGAVAAPLTIAVQGRRLAVPKAAQGVGWFSFAALCERPLGAADYIAIASRFHTLFIAGVPTMVPEQRNAAYRFMTLIDALYEHKVNLICSAAVAPQQLYPSGDGAAEFRRTASRLMEMQSIEYLERPHLP